MRFVRTSNKDFRKLETHIYVHMHTRKMQELLNSLKSYAKSKHISTLPASLVYYYIVHHLFFADQQLAPFTFTHQSLTLSKRPYYQSLQAKATTNLRHYLLTRVY